MRAALIFFFTFLLTVGAGFEVSIWAEEPPLYLYTFTGRADLLESGPLYLDDDYRVLDTPRRSAVEAKREAEAAFTAEGGYRVKPTAMRLPTALMVRPRTPRDPSPTYEPVIRVLSPVLDDQLPPEPQVVKAVRLVLLEDGVERSDHRLDPPTEILRLVKFAPNGQGLLVPHLTRGWREQIGREMRERYLDIGLLAEKMRVRVDLELEDEGVPRVRAFSTDYHADTFRRDFFLAESRVVHPEYLYSQCERALQWLRRPKVR